MAIQFDPAVLSNDPKPRREVLEVLTAAVESVDPATAVRRHLARDDRRLHIGGQDIPEPTGRVVVLALGKAAITMAAAAVDVLGGLRISGVVAAPSFAAVPGLEVIVTGHPLPDEASIRAGRLMLTAAESAGPEDLILVLISGGGSAMAEVPVAGLSLADLRAAGDALLRAGAPIAEVNTVRRHLSAVKGGRLAAAAAPAQVASLIISDVVGDPLEVIAGGPTVSDPTSATDAMAVLAGRGVVTPAPVVEALRREQETPGRRAVAPGIVSIIADGSAAAAAAVRWAEDRGLAARVASTTVEGEARLIGAELAGLARGLSPGTMLIHSGETTVTVVGGGCGGRNHEVALAAGIALEGQPDALVASLGTDGVDGPSGAAGGIGDGETVARGHLLGIDPGAALDDNDSAGYLRATGDQLRCGPTGTNVGDLMVVYRHR